MIKAVDAAEMVQALLQERFPFLSLSVLDAVGRALNASVDPRSEIFAEKVASAMKLDDPIRAWASKSPDPEWVIKMVEEGLLYEEKLQALEYQSLREAYNDMQDKQGRRRDKHLFFVHPAHTPDFDVWNRRSCWTIEEAVALSLEKEPTAVNTSSLSKISNDSAFKQEFHYRLDVLRRRLGTRASELISATEYVALLRDFSLPPHYGVSSTNESSPSRQEIQSEIIRLQNEIEKLKAEIAEMRKQPEDFDKHGSMCAS